MLEPEHIDRRRAALMDYDDRPAAGATRSRHDGASGAKGADDYGRGVP